MSEQNHFIGTLRRRLKVCFYTTIFWALQTRQQNSTCQAFACLLQRQQVLHTGLDVCISPPSHHGPKSYVPPHPHTTSQHTTAKEQATAQAATNHFNNIHTRLSDLLSDDEARLAAYLHPTLARYSQIPLIQWR